MQRLVFRTETIDYELKHSELYHLLWVLFWKLTTIPIPIFPRSTPKTLPPHLHRAPLNVPLRTAGAKIYNPPPREFWKDHHPALPLGEKLPESSNLPIWSCRFFISLFLGGGGVDILVFSPGCTAIVSGLFLTCSSIVYFIPMEFLKMYDMYILGTVIKLSSLWLSDGGVHLSVNHEILQYCRTPSSKRRWNPKQEFGHQNPTKNLYRYELYILHVYIYGICNI